MLEFIGGGSRSTTPHSLISRKSPSNDMGVQAGTGGGNSHNQSRESNRGEAGKRNNSQSSGGNGGQQRNRRDSGRGGNQQQEDGNNKRDQNQGQQPQGQRNFHNSNGQFNNKYQRNPNQALHQGQGGQGGGQQQQNRMGGNNGGGWVQRGGGVGGGAPNQMRGQRGGRMNTRSMNNPVSTGGS